MWKDITYFESHDINWKMLFTWKEQQCWNTRNSATYVEMWLHFERCWKNCPFKSLKGAEILWNIMKSGGVAWERALWCQRREMCPRSGACCKGQSLALPMVKALVHQEDLCLRRGLISEVVVWPHCQMTNNRWLSWSERCKKILEQDIPLSNLQTLYGVLCFWQNF